MATAAETRRKNAEIKREKLLENARIADSMKSVCLEVMESRIVPLSTKMEAVKILFTIMNGA